MYLYYDRYGTLKEQITFNPARVGNSNVNKIFVYWEGVEEFPDWAQELALQTRYLLQDNTQYPSATTFGFSAQPETAELPFDKNQDLKYFKYYKEYKFLTIDIPDEVLSYNGAVKSYIWVLNADKKRILGLGVFAFMVDGDINEVIPDENISLAQWNMISAQLGLLSGSVIDVTCDIATNTLKVYYANGLTAVRNLPPNGAQTTISSDFLREMIFSTDAWVQDGEQGYYLALSSSQVGFTDNKFFIQLEEKGEYNSKQGGFVLSDNIFKGNDGSVLLYSAKPFDGRLLLVGGDLLSGDILVTGLSYNGITGQLTYKTADGVTHSIYLDIPSKLDKSSVVQTTGDSTVKVMSQKAATYNFARLVDGKVPESQLPSYVDDVVEYDSKSAFPAIGEEGKIYVDKSTNLTYRWSGSTYIQVGGGDLNLENGTGLDSLVQKYSGEVDATHFGNTCDGESGAVFGEANFNSGNRTLISGKMNRGSAPNSLIIGLGNGRGIDADPTIDVLSGEQLFVFGALNSVSNGDGNAVLGAENILSDVRYTTIIGRGNIINNASLYEGKCVVGRFNNQKPYTMFEVGVGDYNNRVNGFEVYKDGRAKVRSAPTENDDVVRLLEVSPILSDYVDDTLLGG